MSEAALRWARSELGVPELTPVRSVRGPRSGPLLAEPDWLDPACAPDLDEADRAHVRGCGAALRTAAQQLADALPAAVQHDDLHGSNVFVRRAEPPSSTGATARRLAEGRAVQPL